MGAQQELEKSDYRVVAWEEYKKTEDFRRIVDWIKKGHYMGELWAVFLQGTYHAPRVKCAVKDYMVPFGDLNIGATFPRSHDNRVSRHYRRISG